MDDKLASSNNSASRAVDSVRPGTGPAVGWVNCVSCRTSFIIDEIYIEYSRRMAPEGIVLTADPCTVAVCYSCEGRMTRLGYAVNNLLQSSGRIQFALQRIALKWLFKVDCPSLPGVPRAARTEQPTEGKT